MSWLSVIRRPFDRRYPMSVPSRRLAAGGAVLAWMALIFSLSSLAGEEVQATLLLHSETSPLLVELRSAVDHLALFGVLATLLHFNARSWKADAAFRLWWLLAVAALASFYGIAMEYYQVSVPGRSASLLDMVANSAGAVIAAAALRCLARPPLARGNSRPLA